MSFAITQETKHGSICLSLPHQPFEVDITVFVDVERNPGPSTALGFKCAGNFGNFDSPTPNVWSEIIYSRLDLLSLKKALCSYIEPYVFNNLKDLGILRLRCSRAGKQVFKTNSQYIAVIIRQDQSYTFNHRQVNFANLREICISPVATSTITDQTKLCLWNAQSLRNKTTCLVDYICEGNVDLFAVTESWLMETDTAVKSECTLDGYVNVNVYVIGHSPSGLFRTNVNK